MHGPAARMTGLFTALVLATALAAPTTVVATPTSSDVHLVTTVEPSG